MVSDVLPAQLLEEVESLKKEGFEIDVIEAEGWANVLFHNYPVPPGFTKSRTDLLLRMPMSYPNGKPDMFWTEVDFLLEGGAVPAKAEKIMSALGRDWRRFSWHPSSWNPARDDLRTFLEFVNQRLAKPE